MYSAYGRLAGMVEGLCRGRKLVIGVVVTRWSEAGDTGRQVSNTCQIKGGSFKAKKEKTG